MGNQEVKTMADESLSGGTPNKLDSLPDHPLSEREASSLDVSDAVSFFRPVAALNDIHPDQVVGGFIGKESMANIIVFHPGHDAWYHTKTIQSSSPFDTLAFDGRVLNATRSYYGDDVVSHHTPKLDPDTPGSALAIILPNRRITEHDVWLLEDSITNVQTAHPTVVTDTDDTIVVFVVIPPTTTTPGKWVFTGYHPPSETWEEIDSGTLTEATTDFSMDTVTEWVAEHYNAETVEFTTPEM
ncbi:hypothetical protein [Salinibaculum rarum]|uniref:hypothetical protein n=1 Tax=Salinibaculum rarum TaxID=3058903 RepID=UPI00265F59DB|nr:hypothetical protein [Salinibaculum sp. KK48]